MNHMTKHRGAHYIREIKRRITRADIAAVHGRTPEAKAYSRGFRDGMTDALNIYFEKQEEGANDEK